jgi:septal ring-binding cell division protein DamX
MKKYGIVLVGIFIIWACAPKATQPSAKPPEEEVVVIGEEEETTKPSETPTVEEGEVTLEEATPTPPTTEVEEATPTPPTEVKETAPSKPLYGYRVQILATSNKEKADMFAKEAQARFKDQKVYVEFISPYYKVRIGDFLTREEAEAFRAKAKSLGYFDAFIVESPITPK